MASARGVWDGLLYPVPYRSVKPWGRGAPDQVRRVRSALMRSMTGLQSFA